MLCFPSPRLQQTPKLHITFIYPAPSDEMFS